MNKLLHFVSTMNTPAYRTRLAATPAANHRVVQITLRVRIPADGWGKLPTVPVTGTGYVTLAPCVAAALVNVLLDELLPALPFGVERLGYDGACRGSREHRKGQRSHWISSDARAANSYAAVRRLLRDGWTIDQLSRELGVSRTTIAQWRG